MNLIPRNFFLDDVFNDFLAVKELPTFKCDIYEKDNKYFLEADLPGFSKEDIVIEVDEGIEAARDQALQLQAEGKGIVLNQFANPDNSAAHYETTGPELWRQTAGRITHFISSMGTTGTISGTGKYLKEQNPDIQVIGLQPDDESSIAGIRRWPEEYKPEIYDPTVIDRTMDISQYTAEVYMRKLARTEGILAGVSSGAAAWAAIQVAKEIKDTQPDAVIAFIVCDRGDRYLSTGLFTAE